MDLDWNCEIVELRNCGNGVAKQSSELVDSIDIYYFFFTCFSFPLLRISVSFSSASLHFSISFLLSFPSLVSPSPVYRFRAGMPTLTNSPVAVQSTLPRDFHPFNHSKIHPMSPESKPHFDFIIPIEPSCITCKLQKLLFSRSSITYCTQLWVSKLLHLSITASEPTNHAIFSKKCSSRS